MKNPNAIVPAGSMAARNCFNFTRMLIQNGEEYEIPLERVVETESPRGRLIPRLPEENSPAPSEEPRSRRANRRAHHRGLPTGDLDQ